jgi:hypothetical protein
MPAGSELDGLLGIDIGHYCLDSDYHHSWLGEYAPFMSWRKNDEALTLGKAYSLLGSCSPAGVL